MKNRSLQQNINHICITLFSLALLPLSGISASDFSASPLPALVLSPQVPSLQGTHYAVYCPDQQYPTEATTPTLVGSSTEDVRLQYEDRVFDLQQPAGFTGYFALERWQRNYGDGGVDVTGAPNVALVEGASATLVKLMDQKPVTLEIDVPADGYVRFDWRKIGGSYFSISILAGDQQFELDRGRNGYYISPLLHAGDPIRIELTQTETSEGPTEVLLNSFCFYSNAVQVTARQWQAVEDARVVAVFTQLISLEALNLDQIVFPANFQGMESTAIYQPGAMAPEITGYPYLDKDGDPETSEDRFYLETSACSFEVTWDDEIVLEEGDWMILRHWQVKDVIRQNVVEQTQIIRLSAGGWEEHSGEQTDEETMDYIRTVFRERSPIRYLEWEGPED